MAKRSGHSPLRSRGAAALRRLGTIIKNCAGQDAIVAIVAAAVGAVVTAWFCAPPRPPPEIARLIQDEAQLALSGSRDEAALQAYLQLFTEDAVVTDVTQLTSWKGHAEIGSRFRVLEQFHSLDHHLLADPAVRDQGRAAEAHTTTIFRFKNDNNARYGDEKWFFRKANGQWRIAGFYYGFAGFSQ